MALVSSSWIMFGRNGGKVRERVVGVGRNVDVRRREGDVGKRGGGAGGKANGVDGSSGVVSMREEV
jgi:hypothetical protein